MNGKIERISTRLLQAGDTVEIRLAEKFSKPPILYEDEWLLVIDKAPGVVSENSIINHLLPAYKGELLLIHRLDKETSGLLMVAKTAEVKEKMVELFRAKQVVKHYFALVSGRMAQKEGKIENYLIKGGVRHGQTFWKSKAVGREQEKAITFWECMMSGKKSSLLILQPITGRTHQLRVHLSEMGHPILGDSLYGKALDYPRQLLHAFFLRFKHPFTQKEVEIKAPLPEDFLKTQKKFEL